MDNKSLKLAIINKILKTDDQEVLQTVANLLDLEMPDHSVSHSPPPPIPSSLFPSSPTQSLEGDAKEIQDSLDELFST